MSKRAGTINGHTQAHLDDCDQGDNNESHACPRTKLVEVIYSLMISTSLPGPRYSTGTTTRTSVATASAPGCRAPSYVRSTSIAGTPAVYCGMSQGNAQVGRYSLPIDSWKRDP